MRKKFFLILALSLVLCFTGIGFAVTAEKGKVNMFAGIVTAVDTKEKTITLKNNKEGPFTFVFTDNTVLRAADGRKSAAEIITGDIAALVYKNVDDKKIATAITVISRASQAKEKK